MSGPPRYEAGEEREVDLGLALAAIRRRWWLVAAGVILGAVAGVFVATGKDTSYKASTLVYLGQPFASGGQIQSLATNPETVKETLRSEAVLAEAATASGLRVSQLRGNVSSRAIASSGSTSRAATPLVEITVRAGTKGRAQTAADSLAVSVTELVSRYVDRKIALLQERLRQDQAGLERAAARITDALEQLVQARTSKRLTLTDRFLLQANANNTLQFWEARTQGLNGSIRDAQQLLSLAENVEKSRIVVPARAVSTGGTSRRTGAVVGGIVGLLVGGILALAWRGRKRPAEG